MSDSVNEVPLLSTICLERILKSSKYKTLEGAMNIYMRLDSGLSIYEKVRSHSKRFLANRFPMLVEKYGREELDFIFNEEEMLKIEAELADSAAVKHFFSGLKGTVLEPTVVLVQAAEDGTYPLEALVQGAAWPADVDPSKREQYLSSDAFVQVFRMSKEAFNLQDKIMRMRQKKECKLF
ncbi:hypothetical protein B484DRAFT_402451 [Ochromonadaceae sp. CCMP2298]|nr:hypothetical protein B484DRAFT_402451 [Ochromonadaceae sp. CCMP2298]|mmetsp:Transcript_14013/g.30972  ORF Transcript_14013/g.30972 Transcript_14013/m.30972 type:complete len:180 (-) Transcript_14013:2254-2793(-)|eukprot:CAMPEP_0173294554 /NCGR_PEP_ID=MMETSP1143-20121109/13943_1 /TAXON_ID=483371 /ORGANISM="non described non described, Strain CCMP2298" /LENGTH=179 /DNA_ID=CAMNT_0014234255 /DNA_START=179 /DNA_END=718 /DNA_ORIENTATION=+